MSSPSVGCYTSPVSSLRAEPVVTARTEVYNAVQQQTLTEAEVGM